MMPDTPFTALLAGLAPEGDGFAVDLAEDWLQGRTAYGGLSAALALEATLRRFPELPPLRSANLAFVGPAMGRLRVAPVLLRQGKSAAFVGADLMGEAGLAVRALFCFGANRESILHHEDVPVPAVGKPLECRVFFDLPDRPGFTRNFDGRLAAGAKPRTPGAAPEMVVWLRHNDSDAGTSPAALIALADALPPAAMILFPTEWRPISTMTWTIDMLTDAPASPSGWWLIRNTAQTALAGYSAQDMMIWDDCGRPVAAMRQTVAIFA